ncbi:helix-turn-helix domain protein [Desulforamulus reducens MI-1]|uniref:Helix-turn-helix domain protein n=1 Tax=Desulforamulus reducens (strain ATCC BAA-1160 / DSM 100696 / MI-1) TaxID=349161 RepID=A4J2V8_DESRM|nr:helix-turn-helix transcriptional regulator [Desulforamulus reducens]ABO49411.1 helix-turn-helix domain protein [Desulforamulus reducens MI-1]
MNYGKRVTFFREKLGISKRKLAKMIGVDPSLITKIEANNTKPSLDTLERICTSLGIELADFFAEECKQLRVVSDDLKSLIYDLRDLRSSQLLAIKKIISEFRLVNQSISNTLSNEVLDLFNSKEAITIAGKPISLEERIQILEALRDILSQEETPTNEDDEVLVASYEGDQLFHLPTPEEAEDIQRAIKAAMEQKRKDQSNNNQSE